MAGIEEKLSGILSDPEAVSKLKSLGAALGLDTGTMPKPPEPKPQSGINTPFAPQSQESSDMMSSLMRLAPLLSDMGKDDEVSCLLSSLKPFLSEPRRSRLEQAGKMLKVMRLLPLIKGTGLM